MKALVIARKEITDLRRSRVLLALLAVLVASAVVEAFGASLNDGGSIVTALRGIGNVDRVILVPFIGILLGSLAITEEVESGSLRVTMGFPVTRRDIVLGKLLGRGTLFVVAVLLAFTVGGVVLSIRFGSLPVAELLRVAGLSLFLGLAYFGLAFGISSFARDRLYALGAALGAYVVFSTNIWDTVFVGPPYYLLTGKRPQISELALATGEPEWYNLLSWANPSRVFIVLEQDSAAFLIVVLLFWTIAPIALGYWRFRGRDVG